MSSKILILMINCKLNTDNVIDILAQYALEKVHFELRSEDIWKHLESRNFSKIQTPKTELLSVDYGLPIPSYFIGQIELLEEIDNALIKIPLLL